MFGEVHQMRVDTTAGGILLKVVSEWKMNEPYLAEKRQDCMLSTTQDTCFTPLGYTIYDSSLQCSNLSGLWSDGVYVKLLADESNSEQRS